MIQRGNLFNPQTQMLFAFFMQGYAPRYRVHAEALIGLDDLRAQCGAKPTVLQRLGDWNGITLQRPA